MNRNSLGTREQRLLQQPRDLDRTYLLSGRLSEDGARRNQCVWGILLDWIRSLTGGVARQRSTNGGSRTGGLGWVMSKEEVYWKTMSYDRLYSKPFNEKCESYLEEIDIWITFFLLDDTIALRCQCSVGL